jgi:hypothetical protein
VLEVAVVAEEREPPVVMVLVLVVVAVALLRIDLFVRQI